MRLVAGSSGVLGSGFVDVLSSRGEQQERLVLPWGDPAAVARAVTAQWRAAEQRSPAEPITLVWAAGRGTVGAGPEAMTAETATLQAVVDGLRSSTRGDERDCLLFASSAGAIYGGHGPTLIGDDSPPSPITPYGWEKLAQEALVGELAAAGAMRTVACRFTNVFGLADGYLRPRGLVAALVRSALMRQPARLFVSSDTRRDLLFSRDAAKLALAEADHAASGEPVVCVVRSGSTMTIGEMVASVGRVLRRRVPVVVVESPESAVQPKALRFPERRGVQARVPMTTFEAAVRALAEAPLPRA